MNVTKEWPSDVTQVVWRASVLKSGEISKGPARKWGDRNLPIQWLCLIPLTQVSFIFRSDNVKDNWNAIYKHVNKPVKKYTQYSWHFSLPGRVHNCLNSVETRVPRFRSTEPKVVFWSRRKEDSSIGTWQLFWLLPRGQAILQRTQSAHKDLTD